MKKLLLALTLGITTLTGVYAENEYLKTLDNITDNNNIGNIGDKIKTNNAKDFLISIGNNILKPIIIIIGLLFAFIGFYDLMFSDKEDERKKGLNYIIRGTIGIIIIISSNFIANTLFGQNGTSGILGATDKYDAATIASSLYDKIISKFFYMGMYLVIGILFIILVINLIKFMVSPDKEDVQKHTQTIILWNTIGIILILFSKNIIETFYSKIQPGAYSLGQQNAILESKSLPWLYTILNYFLGFVAFAITVFIIYQAFQLLLKPEDDATYKNLKKYFVYSLLGVLIIGGVYLIANFFIIK